MKDLIGELQRAIRADGRSLYAIAKEAELAYSVVHRFATGERVGISLPTAARLLDVLGYELRRIGEKKGGR